MSDHPPACRIYLRLRAPAPDDLATVLAACQPAAILLEAEDNDAASWRRLADAVRPAAHRHDVAVILLGRPDLARPLGCDGAHIPCEDTASARKTLGDLQLGAFCGTSRDAAMSAGEDGADYVAFAPNADPDMLIGWWSEMMEIPVVADGAGLDPATCAPLVQAGADFLLLGDEIWRAPDGAADAARRFAQAIAEASRARAETA